MSYTKEKKIIEIDIKIPNRLTSSLLPRNQLKKDLKKHNFIDLENDFTSSKRNTLMSNEIVSNSTGTILKGKLYNAIIEGNLKEFKRVIVDNGILLSTVSDNR